MKTLILLLTLTVLVSGKKQMSYPVPPDSPVRLFYIQHSRNTNTYVYDANLKGKSFDTAEPVNVYRIMYAEDGKKAPLTAIQRKLAYGLSAKALGNNKYECNLAALPSKKLMLRLDSHGKPQVTVNCNGQDMVLTKLFIKNANDANPLKTEVQYIDFTGRHPKTGIEIKERFYPENSK